MISVKDSVFNRARTLSNNKAVCMISTFPAYDIHWNVKSVDLFRLLKNRTLFKFKVYVSLGYVNEI